VAAAALVNAFQSLVSRETAPTDGAVVSVSRFNTGEKLCKCSIIMPGLVGASRKPGVAGDGDDGWRRGVCLTVQHEYVLRML